MDQGTGDIWECCWVVEHMLNMWEALGSIPSAHPQEKEARLKCFNALFTVDSRKLLWEEVMEGGRVSEPTFKVFYVKINAFKFDSCPFKGLWLDPTLFFCTLFIESINIKQNQYAKFDTSQQSLVLDVCISHSCPSDLRRFFSSLMNWPLWAWFKITKY